MNAMENNNPGHFQTSAKIAPTFYRDVKMTPVSNYSLISKRTEQLGHTLGRDVTCLRRSQIFVAKKEMIEIIEGIEIGDFYDF